jgi:ATP-binding cassette subfamily B protein
MNYSLSKQTEREAKKSFGRRRFDKILSSLRGEKRFMLLAFVAIVTNAGFDLLAPTLIGHTIDVYIKTRQYQGVLFFSVILFFVYVVAALAGYLQTRVMGAVGQRVLYKLRNAIFTKLQTLPIAFFNQNQTGDLISRINNDTDKLNQFFAQALMQFTRNIFLVIGVLILVINPRLGAAALIPALGLLIITRAITGWVRKKNALSLKTTGNLSAEVQESLNNFKVIVAFNRRDYFRERFHEENKKNFLAALKAGFANNIFTPTYDLAGNVASLVVLAFGGYLIAIGNFSVGFLITYLIYVSRFYDPLRQMASIWATFQLALVAWDRIAAILDMESDLSVVPKKKNTEEKTLLKFENVYFQYPNGKTVLNNINFSLESGKTYALVGPTGGGKTTTAFLIARLYDPTKGAVYFKGQDIRSYEPAILTKEIGFILQEPFLFSGTVRDNLTYGNSVYAGFSSKQVEVELRAVNLDKLMTRFSNGLDTAVSVGGESVSLGQKQLIAFIRAVLRKPKLLILDEATANVDTVTEQLLAEILQQLPKETTRVVIAHRLNTIENADEIFFVNGGEVFTAGSMEHAVELLTKGKLTS